MPRPPGVPMESGFRSFSTEELEKWRRENCEFQQRILTVIEDVERCRRRAAAASVTAVIG